MLVLSIIKQLFVMSVIAVASMVIAGVGDGKDAKVIVVNRGAIFADDKL